MYAGEIVLDGSVRSVLKEPAHPYARGLLASIPRAHVPGLPLAMEGRPPAPGAVRDGCAFADRCDLVEPECRHGRMTLVDLPGGQRARCRRSADVQSMTMRDQRRVHSASGTGTAPLLSLMGLSVSYAKPSLLARLTGRTPPAPTVAEVSLSVREGETVALVGESGSGKSTILRAVAGLVGPAAGEVMFRGTVALPPTVEQRRPELLRHIQLVFQNPDESLNPRQTVGEILAQPLSLYFDLTVDELRHRSIDLLEQVRLGEHYLHRFPAQLSGGEKQRVAIARAFAAEPSIVLCDEVTSALDVSVQAAVLELLDQLKRERGTTYVFVSHDLGVVRAIADRAVVLYQGRICESGPVQNIFASPSHPYTEALLGAMVEPDPDHRPVLLAEDMVEGAPSSRGCPFQRRCHRRLGPICDSSGPPAQLRGEHMIRCHIPLDELEPMQDAGGSVAGTIERTPGG